MRDIALIDDLTWVKLVPFNLEESTAIDMKTATQSRKKR